MVKRGSATISGVKLKSWRYDLRLAHRWAIASGLGPGGGGGTDLFRVVFVELTGRNGTVGRGEAAPSSRYEENVGSALEFLDQVDPARLSFEDVPGSMAYLETIAGGNYAPKGALNLALLDGAARQAGKAIYDCLELGFTESKHVTSFSIGLAEPDVIRQKVIEAGAYPVLKLKVGGPDDAQNLAALRDAAPEKPVRVDANEAWKTKDEALKKIEQLAADPNIQFVEQPMPADADPAEVAWLRERSPLPIMADEAYRTARDLDRCAGAFDAVNVKLVKTGGITGALEALEAARGAGLKTMIGCMIESSVLITAAAHLAELTDYLDIDGNLLITNDPFRGATSERGIVSFASAPDPFGLRVTKK